MNIVGRLTVKHLAADRSRTVITMIGIAVSVAMITAVFITTASFFNYFGRIALITDGNAHVTYKNVSLETADRLRADDRVECLGLISGDQSESAFILDQGYSERTRTGNIYCADRTNLEQMVSCAYEGELPADRSEIAVEESLIKRNDLAWKVGDVVTMSTGMREWINGDGEREIYIGNWRADEVDTMKSHESLRISAVLHSNPGTMDYQILRGAQEGRMNGPVNAMVRLKKTGMRSVSEIRAIADEYGISDLEMNTDYLDAHFSLRKGSAFTAMLPVITIIMLVITAASVILIYNAFAMSLAERVRYLGMLASVGTTKKQKRRSVYYEGLILGLAGIPAGILAGIAGIGITLSLISDRISSTGMISAIEDNPGLVELELYVSPLIIGGITVMSIVTIWLASLVPAARASGLMPVDAIRQTRDIRVRAGRLRSPRYIRLLFGYEGELAYKNIKRNGGKARVISVSLAVSVVLFLCVNYFCTLFWQSNSSSFSLPFDVAAMTSFDSAQRLEDEVRRIDGVKDVYPADMIIYEYNRDSSDTPDLGFLDPENLNRKYRKMFRDKMNVDLMLVSDSDFRDLCASQGLDREKYYGSQIRAALLNNVSYTAGGSEVFSQKVIGKKMFYEDRQKHNPAVVEIGDLVGWEDNDHLYGMHAKNRVTAIAPISNYVNVLYGGDVPEGFGCTLAITADDHSAVYRQVQDILDMGGYPETYCQDIIDSTSVMTTVLFILEVFTYGFIALITLITLANMINSISTGIMQRRKEFAVLRSVGMAPAGFRKMIMLESFLYGFRALIWGIPVSLVLSLCMNRSLSAGLPFEPELRLYLEVAAGVFAVVGLTMLYSVSRLGNDTIADVLKEDLD